MKKVIAFAGIAAGIAIMAWNFNIGPAVSKSSFLLYAIGAILISASLDISLGNPAVRA